MIRKMFYSVAIAIVVAAPTVVMGQSDEPQVPPGSKLDSLRQAVQELRQQQPTSPSPDDQPAPGTEPDSSQAGLERFAPGSDQPQDTTGLEGPSAPAAGETQPKARPVVAGGDKLGCAVAAFGDLDGDGVPEYAVGAFAADSGGNNAGCVLVISGATTDTLLYLTGEGVRDNLGYAVAVADVNGDGTPDLIAGAPGFSKNDSTFAQVGRVYIFDGSSGSALRRIDGTHGGGQFGFEVASAGDADGDGSEDFAVAERVYKDSVVENVSAVHLYSGKTSSLIRSYVGTEVRDRFGEAMANAGDLDGDGVDDLLVGARRHSAAAISAGRVYAFSGQAGEVIYTVDGHALFEQFGAAVEAVGDIDGDGTPDFAVGAPVNDEGAGRGGCVYLYSGRDGKLITKRVGTIADQQLGCRLAACGDLNRDAVPDLLAGAGGRTEAGKAAGAAYVLSGSDISVIFEFAGAVAGDNFGRSVAGPGDVNGDGVPDLLIGAFGNDDNGVDAGKVYLYSGADQSLLVEITGTSTIAVADTVTPEKPAEPVVAAVTEPSELLDSVVTSDSLVMPDTVYNIPELDNPPFLRRNIEAVYPPSAIGTGATGWVQVRVLVLDDGMPGLIEIADDAGLGPEFRQSSIAAARQWEFAAATKDGRDVASWMVVPIGFQDPGHGEDSTADTTAANVLPEVSDTTVDSVLDSAAAERAASTIDRGRTDSVQFIQPPQQPAEPIDTVQYYDWSEVDQQPGLVQQVDAEYPVKALEDGDTATVMARVLVLRDGSVGDVQVGRVTNPDKGFEEAAEEAIRKWRFEPGRKGELAVHTWVNYPIRFTLPE